MTEAAILILAVWLDWVIGEPPRFLHPVVGMGKAAAALEALVPRRGRAAPFLFGALATALLVVLFTASSYLLLSWLRTWNTVIYIVAGALILNSTFSLKGLLSEALRIGVRLRQGEMTEARQELRALVSRDTAGLSPTMVASAAVESVAENAADSFVSPLLFFLLLGVPGAMAYRVVNTLDAMWGYHGRYEYIGKTAARLDDLLNLVPARISALLLAIAAPLSGGSARNALRVLRRDRALTASPNAGWPMAAVAGALGVRLEKPGHYILGDNHVPLSSDAIFIAIKMVRTTATLWLMLSVAALGVRFAFEA